MVMRQECEKPWGPCRTSPSISVGRIRLRRKGSPISHPGLKNTLKMNRIKCLPVPDSAILLAVFPGCCPLSNIFIFSENLPSSQKHQNDSRLTISPQYLPQWNPDPFRPFPKKPGLANRAFCRVFEGLRQGLNLMAGTDFVQEA